ncbi:cobalamin biosynthesis protein CobD [Paenibacillus baekrokdamisoli]|uniref:Cobalamin biosynthesis protein CobD n=1 Tax=Paenibacillus baekrokdamisoli TaxID=1712516 RepID=A0A3G9INR7_9BACL|nr:adenosylcobinamide-phosphate synthase CbiB [Paenibacillus baekrokdamisoli]MBB3070615.1 adenosylcobinamide-phosphate synthase [Paenibacillus baekrokdamisoli]BBH19966.1 cobalamin biosynthesis protein CobD [Paenibacillus baekrokdamisoli]
MLFYSLPEILLLTAAAIIIDWIIGDPKWPTHPVIWIGKFIRLLEKRLRPDGVEMSSSKLRAQGVILTSIVTLLSFVMIGLITILAAWIHPWLGYAFTAWYISTTMAVKGLKDAAMLVYRPLMAGNLDDARKYTGYIVSRDTATMEEKDTVRATVETVAENTVDAFVSPFVFALLGGAPLAMLYRAANTLDSMVGYRNEQYLYFGWASARFDDVLNYIPARLAGLLLALSSVLCLGFRAGLRSIKAIVQFANLHPSPNSGIPESAVAGALGIELGGRNVYFGIASERARLGWPLRELRAQDIIISVRLLYLVSMLLLAGVFILWLFVS